VPRKHLDAIISTDPDPDCADRRTSDQLSVWEPGIERANRSTVDHADNHTNIE